MGFNDRRSGFGFAQNNANAGAMAKKSGFNMIAADKKTTSLDYFKPQTPLHSRYAQYDTEVYIDQLEPFPDHPFKMYSDDKLEELADSIRQNGVLNRLIVRQNRETGGYIILSGHNRAEAARRAGLEEVPVSVVDTDDDTAKIIVTESNLKQREKLLPSEKARAYKMQLEALKRQGRRTDLCPMDTKIDSGGEVANQNNESRRQVFRYTRLLELISALLDMVDEDKIPFRAGVELSYLNPDEQQMLVDFLSCCDVKISLEQAGRLKEISQSGQLTIEAVSSILIQTTEPTQELQQKKERGAYAPNPYAEVIKNLRGFFKQLPQNAGRVDPVKLEAAIVTAINNCLEEMGVL